MNNFEYAYRVDTAFKPNYPHGYHLTPAFYLSGAFNKWLREQEGIYE